MFTIFTYILCFNIIITNCKITKEKTDLIAFIKQFMLEQIEPRSFIGYVCWNKDVSIKVLKELNKLGFYTTINQKYFQNVNVSPQFKKNYFVDAKCNGSSQFLKYADANKLFNAPNVWIIFQNTSKVVDKYFWPINSRVYIVDSQYNYKSIQSAYTITRNDSYIYQNVGLWMNGKFEYINEISDTKNRSNLRGVLLNISAVAIYKDSLNNEFNFLNTHLDGPYKFNYVSTWTMLDAFNVTRSLKYHDIWGMLDPKTKMYNGKYRDFQLGIAEIAASPAFLVKDRFVFLDYFYKSPTPGAVLFLAPPLSKIKNIYILPFEIKLWLVTFITILSMISILYAITKFEWNDPVFKVNVESSNMKPGVLHCAQTGISCLCQQGVEAEPKSVAGKITIYVMLLSLLFIYTAYSAKILSLLQSTSNSLRTLEDLNNAKMEIGAEDITYNRIFLRKQSSPEQKITYQRNFVDKNGNDKNFFSVKEGIQKMRYEFFGFHIEKSVLFKHVLDSFYENEICRLKEVRYWSIIEPYVPIKKNSVYKELFRVGYSKLLDCGIKHRIQTRMFTKKPQCEAQDGTFVVISIKDSYFSFVILAVGISISLILLITEIIYNRYVFHNTNMLSFRVY